MHIELSGFKSPKNLENIIMQDLAKMKLYSCFPLSLFLEESFYLSSPSHLACGLHPWGQLSTQHSCQNFNHHFYFLRKKKSSKQRPKKKDSSLNLAFLTISENATKDCPLLLEASEFIWAQHHLFGEKPEGYLMRK